MSINAYSADCGMAEPAYGSFIEAFAAQVARTPMVAALVFQNRQLTYAELDAASNAVANALVELGARPDDRVALCLERGADAIVGMIGILKAGAGFVPIDPANPANRLRLMVADSAPVAIVSSHAASKQLVALGSNAPLLRIEDLLHSGQRDCPSTAPLPEHLAYVIFTSGSSGRPKGVMVEHRHWLHLWRAMEREVFADLPSDARVALNASLSFDASLQAITQLCSGRCVCPVPAIENKDPERMLAFLEANCIAAFDCTPTQLEPLIRYGLFEQVPSSLKAILVGGEVFPPSAWQAAAASGIDCYNVYGPTECTINATLARVSADTTPHLGRPLSHVSAFVVDAQGALAAPGVIGELWLGGEGVARGYLGRPDLTAERFVSNPFDEGRHAYRTGDLCRWRVDGNLEFLGREDEQVKISGYRVELGEIAAHLATHPAVREAVIVPQRTDRFGMRLVAYVVASPDRDTATPADLRKYLARRLPKYMLPYAYVAISAVPVAPGGKIDRSTLPVPCSADIPNRDAKRPVGTVEEAIADIWKELLQVDWIGRDDDFFELGGHSLHAMQVVERLRKIGYAPHLQDLLQVSTLTTFASTVKATEKSGNNVLDDAPNAGTGHQDFLPSFKQSSDWFMNQIAQAMGFPSMCLQLIHRFPYIDIEILQRALDIAVQRHGILRTTMHIVDGMLVQRVHTAWRSPPIAQTDLTEACDAASGIEDIAQRAKESTFDLARLPLFALNLIRTKYEDVLIFTFDHFCMDQSFLTHLTKEMMDNYLTMLGGQNEDARSIPLTYCDFSSWEHAQLDSEQGARHLAYWSAIMDRVGVRRYTDSFADYPVPYEPSHRKSIADALARLPCLPSDYVLDNVSAHVIRVPRSITPVARFEACIDARAMRAISSLAQRMHAPLSAIVIAGLNLALHQLTGYEDTMLLVLSDLRSNGPWEDVGGCFINEILYTGHFGQQATVGSVIDHTVKQMVAADAHKVFPLPRLLHAKDVSLGSLGTIYLNYIGVNGSEHLEPFPPRHTDGGFAALEINFTFLQFNDGMHLTCQYETERFSADTIERVVMKVLDLLERMSNDEHAYIYTMGTQKAKADRTCLS